MNPDIETTITRQAVVDIARGWLDVPWRHQGRNEHGVDCIGLIVMVCRALGLSEYDSQAYGRDPDAGKFLHHFVHGGATRIDPKIAADGDLIVFHQRGFPCHAGIRSTKDGVAYVIHAHAGHRKVVEEVLRPEAPLVAVFRLPGIGV